MRTLASTFKTRAEAEAAGRQLEGLGILRERILMKEMAGGSGGGPGGGIVVTVKVTNDQAGAASDILKNNAAEQSAAPPPAAAEPAAVRSAPTGAMPPDPHRSSSPAGAGVAAGTAAPEGPRIARARAGWRPEPQREDQAMPAPPPRSVVDDGYDAAPARAQAQSVEPAKLGRYLLLFLVAVTLAFLVGAGLGLLIN